MWHHCSYTHERVQRNTPLSVCVCVFHRMLCRLPSMQAACHCWGDGEVREVWRLYLSKRWAAGRRASGCMSQMLKLAIYLCLSSDNHCWYPSCVCGCVGNCHCMCITYCCVCREEIVCVILQEVHRRVSHTLFYNVIYLYFNLVEDSGNSSLWFFLYASNYL